MKIEKILNDSTPVMCWAIKVIMEDAADHFDVFNQDDRDFAADKLHDELYIEAAETGALGEMEYCPERRFETALDEAHTLTDQRYCY